MSEHRTVVYTVNDKEAFQNEWGRIHKHFTSSEGKPWAITAISLDHEMDRLHWIEEALNEGDIPAALVAISKSDIANVKSLDDLRK